MILRWGFYFAILATPVMGGSILGSSPGSSLGTRIDVSGDTSILVHTGDALIFHMFTSSYSVNAAALGLPLHPEDVNFALISDSPSGSGVFSATLESADRAVWLAFGSLTLGPGFFQGSGFEGEAATLQGFLHLSPVLSDAIFSAPSAVIVLRNQGPDVTLGFSSYLLRQDLFTGLSGGPLSVGAVPGMVELERHAVRGGAMNFGVSLDLAPVADVPEPYTGGLLFGGGALLCGLSVILERVSRRGA